MSKHGSSGSKTCRLCVDNNGPFLNIFEFGLNLTTKIRRLLNITINEWDNLPHKICFKCSTKVTELDEFAQNCVKIQEKLRAEYGKGFQHKDERASKFRTELEKRTVNRNISNDKYYSELIDKVLNNLPFQNDNGVNSEKPIIFKDVSVVLTKIEDEIKPLKNNSDTSAINEKDWKKINVTGIGTAYCCVKCDCAFTVTSTKFPHKCLRANDITRRIFNENRKNDRTNSEATLDSNLLLPLKPNDTSSFINQYLLKMPDNSYVLLRIIDTDLVNLYGHRSYEIDDVKNQLNKMNVKKDKSVQLEENSLRLPEKLMKSNVSKKIGPLSFMRNTRNSKNVQKSLSRNETQLRGDLMEETPQDNDQNDISFGDFDGNLLVERFSSSVIEEHLSKPSEKSKKIGPLSFMRNTKNGKNKQKSLSRNGTKLRNDLMEETPQDNHQNDISLDDIEQSDDKMKFIDFHKLRAKNGRFLPSKKKRSRAKSNSEDVRETSDSSESYSVASILKKLPIETDSLSLPEHQQHSEMNNYDIFEESASDKLYKVSHSQSGKMVISNVKSKSSKPKSKKPKTENLSKTEIQSPSVIEALQNKQFFTFVNVDPILKQTSNSPVLDFEMEEEEEEPSTSIDNLKPNSRKRQTIDYETNKPTALDACYICDKRFISMSQLAIHLEACFDKNIDK